MDSKHYEITYQRERLERKLREVRRRGFAIHNRHRKYSDLTAISVPILATRDDVLGAVTIRFAKTAVTFKMAVQTYVPEIIGAADKIAKHIKLHMESQTKVSCDVRCDCKVKK